MQFHVFIYNASFCENVFKYLILYQEKFKWENPSDTTFFKQEGFNTDILMIKSCWGEWSEKVFLGFGYWTLQKSQGSNGS